jgi:hypothetical protein
MPSTGSSRGSARFEPRPPGIVLLEQLGRHASATWYSIATMPTGKISTLERRAAAKIVAQYVDRLIALGARTCGMLRPRP